jgi:membrane-associated phospholipid phosphatase
MIYFALLVGLTDLFNVRLGVELLSVSVFVAAWAVSRLPGQFIRDWWFLLVGLIMWNLSGPIAALSSFPSHLQFMLTVDRTLFLGHQPVRQIQLHLMSPHVTWLDLLTAVAYNLHLAEPFIFGFLLWRLNRAVYFQFAASALILLVLGFITFILFPAVPPWMAAERLARIGGTYYTTSWTDLQSLRSLGYAHPYAYVTSHGHVYLPGVQNLFSRVLQWHPMPFHGTPLFYVFRFRGDAIAAMPSEHAAFPVLELLAFARVRRWYALPLGLWVAAVLFSVIYLGEHWVTDVVAGWLYAAVIFGAVTWLCSRPWLSDRSRPRAVGRRGEGVRA